MSSVAGVVWRIVLNQESFSAKFFDLVMLEKDVVVRVKVFFDESDAGVIIVAWSSNGIGLNQGWLLVDELDKVRVESSWLFVDHLISHHGRSHAQQGKNCKKRLHYFIIKF